MDSCKEYDLDDVMAVMAIPLNKYAGVTLGPTIAVSGFDPTIDTNTIIVGTPQAIAHVIGEDTVIGDIIPIIHKTGKAKDNETDHVAGRFHTVGVNCQVDDRDPDVWEALLALERMPSHLLLTFRGGTRAFVQATADTYLCEVERDGSKTTVTWKVQNLFGIQLIC